MTVDLPALPDRGLLADLCRETAAREAVEPDLIERDFYLTRLIWSLGVRFEEELLLKGGTLLSKVDIGFFRMSEDADFVLPVARSKQRGSNVRHLNRVRANLKEIAPLVGVTMKFPGGEVRDGGTYAGWDLDYASDFGPQTIRLEVSVHPALRPSRRVALKQLLVDPLIGDYSAGYCWALNEHEARAEKVRAACTREAIRDFYDLDRIADTKADLTSVEFIELVNAKLSELKAPHFREHKSAFALTDGRKRKIQRSLEVDLPRVLRRDAPKFDLERTLARFEALWSRPKPT